MSGEIEIDWQELDHCTMGAVDAEQWDASCSEIYLINICIYANWKR